ncbi:39S ribosomal protein L33, mitochondrial [Pseudomyrmex gracilis]|uniref:39S ribosomal protein L33, mitochondrial n=1 Tax=Pseudomyrmex gracilis TaxID=219809 RepID=UPI0009953E8B|nr:39S ribosomal protein L33, mitochondrial [Pseudomyrmex gracilis]
MFITNVLLKKAKSKDILVMAESIVSGHRVLRIRERLADKLEFIAFDPFVQKDALYRESKKIRSLGKKT